MDILDSRLISVAILNQNINDQKLQKLKEALASNFSYFEILLINPVVNFTPPPPPIFLINKS